MSNLFKFSQMDVSEVVTELAKVLGGGVGGTFIGFWAQKQAAKSEAVKELQMLKVEYKEFAEFTKAELLGQQTREADCQKENAELKSEVNQLNLKVNDLTMAIHNSLGTPIRQERKA
jgi:uncharacterized protein YlxW (UPF0749 family)